MPFFGSVKFCSLYHYHILLQIQNVISAESYALGHCFQGETAAVIDKPEATATKPPRPKPKPFRLPTICRTPASACPTREEENVPLFDPTLPDALVLPRPPAQHQVVCCLLLVVLSMKVFRLTTEEKAKLNFLKRTVY